MGDNADVEPVILDVACSLCGRPVGYWELYPPHVPRPADRGPEHPLRRLDRYWHYVSDGDRMGNSEITEGEYEGNRARLTGEAAASFVKLYCTACGLVYCWDHWRVGYSDDPLGSPRSWGACPRGHHRIIDMG